MFPSQIRWAGLVWLLVALLQLTGTGFAIAALNGAAVGFDPNGPYSGPKYDARGRPRQSAEAAEAAPVLIGGSCFAVLTILAFCVTGFQALSGQSSSFSGAGLGSIFLGTLYGMGAIAQLTQRAPEVLAILSAFSALGAIGGGVFALKGSRQFVKWRRWHKEREEQPRTNKSRQADDIVPLDLAESAKDTPNRQPKKGND